MDAGGNAYYGRFSPSLPTDPSFFPIGVWLESVTDPADLITDGRLGINTYVALTPDSDLQLLRAQKRWAIHNKPAGAGNETAGWLVSDEADMWARPGDAGWDGTEHEGHDPCIPVGSNCGFTVQQTLSDRLPKDKRLRYSNYGKVVALTANDADAARFVNTYQDVVSADVYWYTDRNTCGPTEGGLRAPGGPRQLTPEECHRASNYGDTVSRVRSLVQPPGSKPVWAYVEVGHPFSEDHWPTIQPKQVRAAVWSSIIHGARGVVYFNHSFGGSCESQHVLRVPCGKPVADEVTALNREIQELAPVLNSDDVVDMVQAEGPVDVMVKVHRGRLFVFAGSRSAAPFTARLRVPCLGDQRVTVRGEHRDVNTTGGVLTDQFDGEAATHIYEVPLPQGCRVAR